MIKINLLPHRAEEQGVSLKIQAAVGGVVLVAVLGVCAYFLTQITGQLSDTQQQITQVQAETKRLQGIIGEIDKIKERKADLEKQLAVIDDLEKGRLDTVKLMEDLARAAPEQLWFDKLDFKSGRVALSGAAVDNQVIAAFIQNLNQTPGISGVVLSDTTRATVNGLDVVKYNLSFSAAPNRVAKKEG